MNDFSSLPTFGAPIFLINQYPYQNGVPWALNITDKVIDRGGSTLPHVTPFYRNEPDFRFRLIPGKTAGMFQIQNLVTRRIIGKATNGRVDMGWNMTGGVATVDEQFPDYFYDFCLNQENWDMIAVNGNPILFLEAYDEPLKSAWKYQWMGVQLYKWSQGGSPNQRWGWEYVFSEGSRLTVGPDMYLVLDGLLRHIPNPATHDQLWEKWIYSKVTTYPERNEPGLSLYTRQFPPWTTLGKTYDGNELFWKRADESLTDGAYLARDVSNGKVYLVSNGMKRWISSADVFNKFQFGWSKVRNYNPSELATITTGKLIG